MLCTSCKYVIAEASCCAAVRTAFIFGGPGFLPDGAVLNTPLSMAACGSAGAGQLRIERKSGSSPAQNPAPMMPTFPVEGSSWPEGKVQAGLWLVTASMLGKLQTSGEAEGRR